LDLERAQKVTLLPLLLALFVNAQLTVEIDHWDAGSYANTEPHAPKFDLGPTCLRRGETTESDFDLWREGHVCRMSDPIP